MKKLNLYLLRCKIFIRLSILQLIAYCLCNNKNDRVVFSFKQTAFIFKITELGLPCRPISQNHSVIVVTVEEDCLCVPYTIKLGEKPLYTSRSVLRNNGEYYPEWICAVMIFLLICKALFNFQLVVTSMSFQKQKIWAYCFYSS